MAYDAIIACGNRQGCIQNDRIDDGCLLDRCANLMEVCFGPPVQPIGDLTCMEINACYTDCNNSGQGQDCRDACEREASANGLQLLRTVMSCVQQNNCADMECINENCREEYVNCRVDSSGNALCQEISDCYFGCPANDDPCRFDCYFEGQFRSQDKFADLTDCMTASGCNIPNDCGGCVRERDQCQADEGDI